ncbi:MAG: hypothetical protein FWG31_02335 [Oscillospiraceae bacterium]|nr:hypothetical protein [Oscillospiraceae bacterium]
MPPTTKTIYDMVELLSDREKELVYALINRLLPDDIATPDDLADIAQARAEYERGETIPLSNLNLNS